jgi:hypothetical protein
MGHGDRGEAAVPAEASGRRFGWNCAFRRFRRLEPPTRRIIRRPVWRPRAVKTDGPQSASEPGVTLAAGVPATSFAGT